MDIEILNYAQARYEEEHKRFDQVEEKAIKLVSFLTIGAAVVAALFGEEKRRFSLEGLTGGAILIVSCFLLLTVFAAWVHAMLAVKVATSTYAARNRETFDYLTHPAHKNDDAKPAHQHIFNCYIDSIEKLIRIVDEKARNLKLAQQEVMLGGGLLFILLVLIGIQDLAK